MDSAFGRWRQSLTRRKALRGMAGFFAASPLARGQQDAFRDHSRIPALDEMVTSFDFEPVMYAKVPRDAADYTALGAEGEFTLRRNREAFDWVDLVPRAFAEVSRIDTRTEVLGVQMDFPIMVAPSAAHGQLHPEGEKATYEGASAASKTPLIVSVNASFPMDQIAAAGDGPLWYQLYARDTEAANRELVGAAVAAGSKAVVLTVDVQMHSLRERALHNRRPALPSRLEKPLPAGRPALRNTQNSIDDRISDGR